MPAQGETNRDTPLGPIQPSCLILRTLHTTKRATSLWLRILAPASEVSPWNQTVTTGQIVSGTRVRVSKILAALPIEIIDGNRFTTARVPVPLLYLFLITSGGSRAHRVRECGKDRRRLGELEGR